MPLPKREASEPSSALTARMAVSGLGTLLVAACQSRSSGCGARARCPAAAAPRDCALLAAVAARSIAISPRCITPLAFCSCLRRLPACSACCPSPWLRPKPSSLAPASSSLRPCCCCCLASVRARLSRMSAPAAASSLACFSKKADLACPRPSRMYPNVLAASMRPAPTSRFSSSSLACSVSAS